MPVLGRGRVRAGWFCAGPCRASGGARRHRGRPATTEGGAGPPELGPGPRASGAGGVPHDQGARSLVPSLRAPGGCAVPPASPASPPSPRPQVLPLLGLRSALPRVAHAQGRELSYPRGTEPVPSQAGHRTWPSCHSATRIRWVAYGGAVYSGCGPGLSSLMLPLPRHLGHSGSSSKDISPLTVNSPGHAATRPVACLSKDRANATGLTFRDLEPGGADRWPISRRRIVEVESLIKSGQLVACEAAVKTGSRRSEVQVDPDGTLLSQRQ
jgi:hypothetical protein